MAVDGLQPFDENNGRTGNFLTFIVPAPYGCNLKCPFCVIRQRQEILEDCLRPWHLARFIEEAANSATIFALSIQGYEPLLKDSMAHTQTVLAAGHRLGLPTAMVTNGVYLREATEWLASVAPMKIGVSLDAASSEAHDKIRGVPGAWHATIDGLRHALDRLAPQTAIAVASVLTSNRALLDDMPKLLRDIGITDWIVTPLQRIAPYAGGPAGKRAKLYKNLLHLQRAADAAGIRMTVDDELDSLRHKHAVAENPELGALHVRTLPRDVDLFRLVPSGHCSMNGDILRPLAASTPRWRPEEMDAGLFLERVKREYAAPRMSVAA